MKIVYVNMCLIQFFYSIYDAIKKSYRNNRVFFTKTLAFADNFSRLVRLLQSKSHSFAFDKNHI